MQKMHFSKARIFTIFFIVLCIAIILKVSILALSNPYLWYDEAGQFWMSMGLNHYSLPFSERGCAPDVINNNRLYNMDPGGFSLILFLWMHISTDIIFVRTLPYLFFLGTCFFLAIISYRETNNKIFALFMMTLPFLMPYVINRAGELRAYSMEMMGMIVGVLLLMRIKQRVTFTNILTLSAVLAITCTSRYASVVASFAISLRLLYLLYFQHDFKRLLQYLLVYSIPLISMVLLIYIGMMKFQNSSVEELSYAQYIFSSPKALLHPISLVYYSLIIVSVIERKRGFAVSEIAICGLFVGTTFFFFSLADKYPWDEIKTMPATILMSFGLMIELHRLFGQNERFVNTITTGVLIVLSVVWIAKFDRLHRGDRVDRQMTELNDIVTKENFSLLFVDLQYTPGVRYFFEYGNGKNIISNVDYPHKFYFQTGPNHAFNNQNKKKIVYANDVNADFYFLKYKGLPDNVKKHFKRYKDYQFIFVRE